MRHLLLFLLLALATLTPAPVRAQTAGDLNEGLRVATGAQPDEFTLSWWGLGGRTYFIQQSLDLVSWQFVPAIQSGTGAVCGMNFSCTDPRQFWRLVYTDVPPAGGNALTADFDGDGLSNEDEVSAAHGTNPFLRDTDWDGFADLAEILAGTDPTAAGSTPGGGGPTSGPLNPDSTYRRGLRLAYSQKSMGAYSYRSSGPPSYFAGWGSGGHNKAGGITDYFYPWVTSSTKDLTGEVQEAYESASFLAADRFLFATGNFYLLDRLEYRKEIKPAEGSSDPTTNTTQLQRNSIEVQAQASGAAPPDARRTLAVFFYKDFTAPENLQETGTLSFSQHNVEPSESIRRHCQISGNKVIIEPALESASSSTTNQRHFVLLMSVGIEPEDGMAGVVGDVIKSAKPGSRVRHFVTPKKSAELPQDYVELTAQGPTDTQFDARLMWDGGEPGSAANKRRVKRDATGMTPVKIRTKKDGVVVDEMQVWVVWCDAPTVTVGTAVFQQEKEVQIVLGVPTSVNTGAGFFTSEPWQFKFAIRPSSICDLGNLERPDLSGPNRTRPPGADKPYCMNLTPENPRTADDATQKWDVSRQVELTLSNSGSIPKASLNERFGYIICANQPVANDTPVGFPTNPVEGNDDPELEDEGANPYQAVVSGFLQHGIGELTSLDVPNLAAFKRWGAAGYHFGCNANFREFCRLEIDGQTQTENAIKWFRISDYYEWHYRFSTDYDGSVSQWLDSSPGSNTGEQHSNTPP